MPLSCPRRCKFRNEAFGRAHSQSWLGLRLLVIGYLTPSAHIQRFQALILISLAGRFADAEVNFGVHRADLKTDQADGDAEHGLFRLENVVDVFWSAVM